MKTFKRFFIIFLLCYTATCFILADIIFLNWSREIRFALIFICFASLMIYESYLFDKKNEK